MATTQTPLHKPVKKQSRFAELPGILLGWIFILAVLFGIALMLLNARPEKKLVCDSEARRTATLTKFGTCHYE